MNPFARFACFTVARDAGFVMLAGGLVMICVSMQPVLALKIGATIALIFSVGLVARAHFLTEERLERSEVWRALPEVERPPGEDGRRWALGYFEGLLLRAAKRASACAGALYCTALVVGLAASLAQDGQTSLHAFVAAEPALIVVR